MYGYIYKTTNLINGKIYIGKRKGEFTTSYKGSGKYLKNALNKYGVENFSVEVIEYCETLDIQNEREKYWISYYQNLDTPMYNIAKGGDGGDTYCKLSKTDRDIMLRRKSEASRNNQIIYKENYANGHKKAWETRRKNGNDKMSIEQRRKLSEAHKGYKPSKESIQKGIESRKGYKHSEETKRKISKSNKGKKRSVETRLKLSQSLKGKQCGELNGFYGKTHTEKTKELIGSYNKERFANRVWINNGEINKRVLLTELEKYKELGFKEGRIKWRKQH